MGAVISFDPAALWFPGQPALLHDAEHLLVVDPNVVPVKVAGSPTVAMTTAAMALLLSQGNAIPEG